MPEDQTCDIQADPFPPGQLSCPRLLVVGPVAGLDSLLASYEAESIVSLPCSRLSAALLAEIAPAIVIAPLVSAGLDMFDIGARLRAANFTGPVHVLTPPLPDPEAVADELRSELPELEIALIPAGAAPVSG